jgi:hypothetical protein
MKLTDEDIKAYNHKLKEKMYGKNLTLSDLETYIEKLVQRTVGDSPYTIDWAENTVRSEQGNWSIRIPEIILRDIKLEEI